MTIGIVGTPAHQNNNVSYTAGAGSNRVVVGLCWNRRTGAVSQTNTVWNSITRSPTTTGNDAAGNDRDGTGITIFKESEIGGASNYNSTWTSTPSDQGVVPVTVQDVDQTTTVRSSSSENNVTTGSSTVCTLTFSSKNAGDLLLACITNRNGQNYTTVNNSWTQLITGANGGGGQFWFGYKVATGSSDDMSVTLAASDGWQASGVVLMPVSAASTAGRNRMMMGFG